MLPEDKKLLKKAVESKEGLISPATMINSFAQGERWRVEKLVVEGYLEIVPEEIRTGTIINFYRVRSRGFNQFAPLFKRVWFNFKENQTLYVAVASILFGLASSLISLSAVQNSKETNIISEQPFLNFTDINNNPYKFINSGKGVALNIFLVLWDKPGNQLYVTPENAVLEAGAPGTNIVGSIEAKELVRSSFLETESKLPFISKLFKTAIKENTSWFALIYQDIYGRRYATLVRGPGTKEYTKAVEFIDLSN